MLAKADLAQASSHLLTTSGLHLRHNKLSLLFYTAGFQQVNLVENNEPTLWHECAGMGDTTDNRSNQWKSQRCFGVYMTSP